MNFILSIFLCFALAFSGTGALPAEPETATTWTVRSISFDDGTESHSIDPELRLTTAVGAEKADLHFEIESGSRALLPVSVELTPDELRFAISGGKHAYSLTNEEFLRLADIDEEDMRLLIIVGDFLTSYGALLGSVYHDQEQAMAYSQATYDALLTACGSSFEPVEIERNGETLEAQRAELVLTVDATFQLLDGLRACGIEPMEQLMDSALALCGAAAGVEYADFAALAAEIDEEIDFAMPMTVTLAATDDEGYCLIESSFGVEDASMQLREEIVYAEEETNVEMTMDMTGLADNTNASYVIFAQMEGPLDAPTSVSMSYDIVMTSDVQIVYEAEETDDGAAVAAAPEGYTDRKEIHMTFDSDADNGLDDAVFVASFLEYIDDEEQSSGTFYLTATERSEDDGSVTADVALRFLGEDSEFGICFELNRSEDAPADLFDGRDVYELTAEELDNLDAEEPSDLMRALRNDASLLMMDAMQLSMDESIQLLVTGAQDVPAH